MHFLSPYADTVRGKVGSSKGNIFELVRNTRVRRFLVPRPIVRCSKTRRAAAGFLASHLPRLRRLFLWGMSGSMRRTRNARALSHAICHFAELRTSHFSSRTFPSPGYARGRFIPHPFVPSAGRSLQPQRGGIFQPSGKQRRSAALGLAGMGCRAEGAGQRHYLSGSFSQRNSQNANTLCQEALPLPDYQSGTLFSQLEGLIPSAFKYAIAPSSPKRAASFIHRSDSARSPTVME